MKRSMALFVLLAFALAIPVLAGGEGKCGHDAQACLNYMASKMKDRGWAGVELDESGESMTVTKVHPGTPAEQGGVKVGDALVAINGLRLGDESNKEALSALWGEMKPGKTFDYTVVRKGKERAITLTLAAMPEEAVIRMVGTHMLHDHATVEVASK